MTDLKLEATKEGTYVATGTYTDADGTAVTPTALTWSLTDDDGNVINSRTGVAIVTPGTSNAVVISGDDLKDDGEGRIFTLNGVYNSSTYGNNLPIKAQARFVIGKWIDVG